MGILLNCISIFAGGTIGCIFEKRMKGARTMMQALGIAVMFISVVNIMSDSLIVSNQALQTKNVIIIVMALLLGTFAGELADIDARLKMNDTQGKSKIMVGFISGFMLFAVGGLQISGPISCMVKGDNSVLITKCLVDFPLAVSFGAMLGKGVGLSAIPVALMQVVIGLIAVAARGFFTDALMSQLNVMGYLLLFFVGFNMVFDGNVRIKTNNMLPSLGVVIIYNLFGYLIGGWA